MATTVAVFLPGVHGCALRQIGMLLTKVISRQKIDMQISSQTTHDLRMNAFYKSVPLWISIDLSYA